MNPRKDILVTVSQGTVPNAEAVTSALATLIDGYHQQVSRNLVEYITRNRSWWAKLRPTELDRYLKDTQLNQARTEGEYQERLLALATDNKLAAAKETADAWLKSMKVGVRENFFAFVTQRYESLQVTLEERRREFGAHIRQRYAELASYKDFPELEAGYRRSLAAEVEGYFIWVDGLLDRFRSIVDEGVGDYHAPRHP